MKNQIKIRIIIICCALIFLFAQNSISQDLNYAVLDRKNIVNLFGYSRVTHFFNNRLIWNVQSQIAIALPALKVSRYGMLIGGYGIIMNKSEWKIIGGLKSSINDGSNNQFNSIDYAGAINLTVGFYKPKWFLASELFSIIPIISKVTFANEEYRTLYGGQPDGWINPNSVYFGFGIKGGCTIKERTDIILKIGRTSSEKDFNQKIPSQFYFALNLNYRFGKQLKNDN